MKFGTFNLHAVPPTVSPYDVIDQQFEQMIEAEKSGFHEIWLAEHNGRRYGMVGNVLAPAAALARSKSRIRIATAVTRLPLHHPVHLAEDLAYIDALSHGRLDFGVGKGYDKLEFDTYGVPFDRAARIGGRRRSTRSRTCGRRAPRRSTDGSSRRATVNCFRRRFSDPSCRSTSWCPAATHRWSGRQSAFIPWRWAPIPIGPTSSANDSCTQIPRRRQVMRMQRSRRHSTNLAVEARPRVIDNSTRDR